MNLNELAVEISKREGGAVNLPIAQIKEVLRCLGAILRERGLYASALIFLRLRKDQA